MLTSKDFQLVIVCSDIGVFGLGLITANTASVSGAGLFRNDVELVIHGAAPDADFSGPNRAIHRIERTAFGTVVPFVSDFSAASALLGNRVIARLIRLPMVLGIPRFAAFGADAAVPCMFLIPLFAAFGADATVPSMLFIPLFTASGADAAIPCVLE
ncbi:MAG: hypothetical protein ABFC31_06805 [Clostridiaceae bacterium]